MQTEAERRVVALLRRHAEPLPDPDEAGPVGPFAGAFERFAGARVVLLGEATHGTSEFYRARAAITRRLIERHGFGIVAVEADWPDAAQVDAYVRHREPNRSGSVRSGARSGPSTRSLARRRRVARSCGSVPGRCTLTTTSPSTAMSAPVRVYVIMTLATPQRRR